MPPIPVTADRLCQVIQAGAFPRTAATSWQPSVALRGSVAATSSPPPWSVAYRASVPSTQDWAREAARAGAHGGSIFVADEQTAGRGRMGRSWAARAGTGLLLSILFEPAVRPSEPPTPHRYTMLVSTALAEAIEQVAPTVRVEVKWPNDLMVEGHKVAGVLAEALWSSQSSWVIVGAGTNVGMDADELGALSPTATSLLVASGVRVDRGDLLRALVARLDHWSRQPHAALFQAWHERLWRRGQRIRIAQDGHADPHELAGVVLGAEPDGRLRIQLDDGSTLVTAAGELIH